MSLLLRDQYIRECWIPVTLRAPRMDPGASPHYPIQLWGVIDDPKLQGEGWPPGPYADVVAYWPALNKWTVTHSGRADEFATDVEVRVTFYQPLPPIPR